MITMKHRNPLEIILKKQANLITNIKQQIKRRCPMILPLITLNIPQFLLIDISATQIDSDVFIVMVFQKEFTDGIDWVAIEFLETWCGEGHGDDAIGYVGEV